jgi:hypothetical protein
MIYRLFVRRYAPFSSFGIAFHGDGRSGPSVSLKDTARTIGVVLFRRTGILGSHGLSSGTSLAGPGASLGTAYATVSATISGFRPLSNGIAFTLATAGGNPMVPGAPDIDTFVDIELRWGAGVLSAAGQVRGDDFPNAEVFLKDAHGRGALLFDFRTGGGRHSGPFTRLYGAHATQVLGPIAITVPLDAAGNFARSVAAPTIHGR